MAGKPSSLKYTESLDESFGSTLTELRGQSRDAGELDEDTDRTRCRCDGEQSPKPSRW
jgi:hypothetical protein